MFNEPENTGEIQVLRDENGRFIEGVSGNIKGKLPGTKNYLTLLEEALRKEAKIAGISYWERLAQWCFTNPKLAVAVLKKFIPDRQHTEIGGIPDNPLDIKMDGLTTEELRALAYDYKIKKPKNKRTVKKSNTKNSKNKTCKA